MAFCSVRATRSRGAAGRATSQRASGLRCRSRVNPGGSPITGRVRAEYILTAPVATVNITAPPAYEAASLDNAGATLTRRVHQGDARETIPNSRWAFADCSSTPFPGKPNAAKVCLDGGFDTNHIYELVYTAKNPTVAGIGFAV